MRSPEMMQWIDADKVALRALLVGGNELIRRDMVPAGASIGHAVSARRIKVDQATGELEKFKSRHAYDGKRMRALLARMGLPPPPTGMCNIVDDFTLKLMFGDMAIRSRYFAKADIGLLCVYCYYYWWRCYFSHNCTACLNVACNRQLLLFCMQPLVTGLNIPPAHPHLNLPHPWPPAASIVGG